MKSRIDWRVDIPCAGRADLSALTLAEYDELQWREWRQAAADAHTAGSSGEPPSVPDWQQRAPATARDRYGWRGLPGTSWLGSAKGFHDKK